MKRTLKSVAPLQLGKILAALYGLAALLFIPVFVLVALIGVAAPGSSGKAAMTSLFLGVGMCIAMPVFYAVMGFLIGVIGAWIYNLLAKWIGGIQFEVE